MSRRLTLVVFKQGGQVEAGNVEFARGWLLHALGTSEEPVASPKVRAVGTMCQTT